MLVMFRDRKQHVCINREICCYWLYLFISPIHLIPRGVSSGLLCHNPDPSKPFCGFIPREQTRPPCPTEPTHHSSHDKPALKHCTQPSPLQNLQGQQLQVSHCQPGKEPQPSRYAAISMLPGPGTHWEAEKQSRAAQAFHRHCTEEAQLNPQGFPGTLFVPPPCHRYPSLPSTLNGSPTGISLSFCKQTQLLSSPLLPVLLATSYYLCFCPDFWTHAFVFLLAPFSLMAAHHTAPLHPFFHFRNLYPIADSHGMQFLQPLKFPCAE